MKRCKHLNLKIYETCEEISTWSVEDGILFDEAYFSPGDLEATIVCYCSDCKKRYVYSKYGYMPKWLKTHVDVITGAS